VTSVVHAGLHEGRGPPIKGGLRPEPQTLADSQSPVQGDSQHMDALESGGAGAAEPQAERSAPRSRPLRAQIESTRPGGSPFVESSCRRLRRASALSGSPPEPYWRSGLPLPPARGDGAVGLTLSAGWARLRYDDGHNKPLLERAGLRSIRFHDLWHTCVTLLLSKNVNPKIVSEMLGYANIAITLDTYSHVLPDLQESAVRALEGALKQELGS
jgi:hypothetical protein